MFLYTIINIITAQSNSISPAWFLSLSVCIALFPIAVALLTSFIKLSIVIGILKNALGTQHAPSNMVSLALSLAISLVVMQPVVEKTINIVRDKNLKFSSSANLPELLGELETLAQPWKNFLAENSGKREIALFSQALNNTEITTPHSNSLVILVPSFLISELKEGFCMAFILLVPFLVIDLIIANILMGLGMMMLSPVVISLPLKLILFVYSDAWLLLTQALIKSYQRV